MNLSEDERKTIVALELEKSDGLFAQVSSLKELGYWDTLASRLYYAAFHAVLALLISDGYAASTHKGAVAMLGLHYVKTGILSEDDGSLYSQLQSLREKSDYNCYFAAGEKEVSKMIEPTKQLIDRSSGIIRTKSEK